MFNIVQGNDFSVDASNFLFPWALEKAPQVFDGIYPGVITQNEFYGPCVIGIDIKSELLIGRECFCVRFFQGTEILIEFRLFLLESLIVHHSVFYIFLKQFSIRSMIYRGPRPGWRRQAHRSTEKEKTQDHAHAPSLITHDRLL